MKQLKFIFILFISLTTTCCYSQKLMKTINDANKFKENENMFINKPLKVLLNEIKPEIKMAYGDPSKNIQSKLGYFKFTFVDFKNNDSLRTKNKKPITIIVYVKEYFDWDFQKRPKGKETVWAQDDVKEYGNLTIIGLRVYGDSTSLK